MQQRAIRTKKKLLSAALRMYTKKGYYYTTVDEIAKEAGVSTGIAYRYFKNKKELLLSALEDAFEHIREMTDTEEADFEDFDSFEEMIAYALCRFEAIHRKYYAFHEELEGLRHSDTDVKMFYNQIEHNAIRELTTKIPEPFSTLPNLTERVYLAVNLMENYCHMTVNAQREELDFHYIKKRTIAEVKGLFCD